MKRRTTPTARSLKRARELGFVADVVERRLPHCFTTKDFCGFADLIVFRPGVGILAVQATSRANHAARRTKTANEPRLRDWLASGGRAEIWSWAKMGERGKRKTWQLWREEITDDDLPAEPQVAMSEAAA